MLKNILGHPNFTLLKYQAHLNVLYHHSISEAHCSVIEYLALISVGQQSASGSRYTRLFRLISAKWCHPTAIFTKNVDDNSVPNCEIDGYQRIDLHLDAVEIFVRLPQRYNAHRATMAIVCWFVKM